MAKGFISKRSIEDLKKITPIDDVVGGYIDLKRSGKSMVACCPFHDEKTPSFYVSREKGSFHCFGCGASGDLYAFIMQYENIPFCDAVKVVADRVGYSLEYEDTEQCDRRDQLLAILKASEHYFCKMLGEDLENSQKYLDSRNISEAARSKYGIGYAPRAWDGLCCELRNKGYSLDDAIEAGVLKRASNGRIYDLYRGRIIFPIRDRMGVTISFGGRLIGGEDGPKYINGPETILFSKSKQVYGFDVALKSMDKTRRHLLVVEGYTDVIALDHLGDSGVVSVCGTSLTNAHVAKLFKHAKELIFMFDGDRAGYQAALRCCDVVMPALDQGKSAYIALLPEGEDPDSMALTYGSSLLNALRTQSHYMPDAFLHMLCVGKDLKDITGKDALWASGTEIVDRMGDSFHRCYFYDQLCNTLGIEYALQRRPKRTSPETLDRLCSQLVCIGLTHPKLCKELAAKSAVIERSYSPHVTEAKKVLEFIARNDVTELHRYPGDKDWVRACEDTLVRPESLELARHFGNDILGIIRTRNEVLTQYMQV